MQKDVLKQLAGKLNGLQQDEFNSYIYEAENNISKIQKIMDEARNSGVVVVFGLYPDHITYDGAFVGESSKNEEKITFDEYGTSFEDGYEHVNELTLSSRYEYDANNRLIEEVYVVDIPHRTFLEYDGEYPYCRGLVFYMGDMKSPLDNCS